MLGIALGVTATSSATTSRMRNKPRLRGAKLPSRVTDSWRWLRLKDREVAANRGALLATVKDGVGASVLATQNDILKVRVVSVPDECWGTRVAGAGLRCLDGRGDCASA